MATPILALLIFFSPLLVFAQAQQATVINNDAIVYQEADFNSAIIATLKKGTVHSISKARRGSFYKIRVKPGLVGWIADLDIKPGAVSVSESESEKPINGDRKNKKPFFATRYRGPAFEMLQYQEDTMGKKRTENLLFYGLKFNGFNTLISGDIYVDSTVLFHSGAPDFYNKVTGQPATGFILIANTLLQTVEPLSRDSLYFYGFGPTVKYSHYELQLPNGGSTLNYSADDLTLGLAINLGLGFRVSERVALRAEAKYYWEKVPYLGAGLGFGMSF